MPKSLVAVLILTIAGGLGGCGAPPEPAAPEPAASGSPATDPGVIATESFESGEPGAMTEGVGEGQEAEGGIEPPADSDGEMSEDPPPEPDDAD